MTAAQMGAAVEWAEYQKESLTAIFGEHPLGVSRDEEKLLGYLAEPMPVSKLHQKMGGRMRAPALRQLIDNLEGLGRIVTFVPMGEVKQWIRILEDE